MSNVFQLSCDDSLICDAFDDFESKDLNQMKETTEKWKLPSPLRVFYPREQFSTSSGKLLLQARLFFKSKRDVLNLCGSSFNSSGISFGL